MSKAYRQGYDRIKWTPLPAPVRKPKQVARSRLPIPMLIRDFDEPVQSMADGKWYHSKAALARSHRASGNPHGQDFVELGNESVQWQEPVPDRAKDRRILRDSLAQIEAGTFSDEV